MTITDYWQALKDGKPTGSEYVKLSGRRKLWDEFNSDRHPQLAKAVKKLKVWYQDPQGAIMLAGNFGCGKSHLARAIHQLYGFGSIYWEENSLLKDIQSTYRQRGYRSEESIILEGTRAELLIYDDLGAYETENMAWLQNIYRQIFDGRCEQGKPTLFTTNLKMPGPICDRIGERNFDRLCGALGHIQNYIALFDVPSYRTRGF